MREIIGNRELIVLNAAGTRIQGTYHRAANLDELSQSRDRNAEIGILFVNSLSLPRASSGDSAVRWAEGFAQNGYPTFRIDLPGLGDSEGHASTDLLDTINAGRFTQVVADAVKEIADRFRLKGLVLFGHCAGSVSALYGASSARECKGVILLDPYFHLPQAKRHPLRDSLSDWARRSAIGRILSNVYDRVRSVSLSARGSSLPGNANTQLLARWKQVASNGMPILMLQAPGIKAQGAKPRIGEFDFVEYALKIAGRKSRIVREFVADADHSFANAEGLKAVESHAEEWLARTFQTSRKIKTREAASAAKPTEQQRNEKSTTTAPSDLGCIVGGR